MQSPIYEGVAGRDVELDRQIASYDRRVREIVRSSEACQRLERIEGVGPATATALVAAVGDRTCLKNGRQFAARLGLVPKQRSSGGRTQLLGISKRGAGIAMLHEEGHPEPWIIALFAPLYDYGLRWGIEAMFANYKTRGFNLEDSQIQRTDRLDRLVLVLSLALYRAVSTGM